MDIETVWAAFLNKLNSFSSYSNVKMIKMAGIPFLYLYAGHPAIKEEVDTSIKTAAVYAMKGKRLHFEMVFVRKEDHLFVYRCRFYVPQEKMFCCGNLCHDCIRFR